MAKLLSLLVLSVLTLSTMAQEKWKPLFNGKNLNGWIVKIANSEVDENPGRMFRVEDGFLTVSYEDYGKEKFAGDFGHIFTSNAYTNYRFRCEYRFFGQQVPDAPKWAYANSGIMLHCPHPSTMKLGQKFPNSAEFQLLGDTRTTGSLFTPGCKVDKDGNEVSNNVKSTIPSKPFGEWVKAEAVVQDGKIQHWINGELVMEYSNARFDDGSPMTGGHIALQAESHPCQFRNIEILVLDSFPISGR